VLLAYLRCTSVLVLAEEYRASDVFAIAAGFILAVVAGIV